MANDYFELEPPGADGIARLTFNRPERMNTMTLEFFELLRAAVQGLHDEGRTRVLAIAAQGKHFSAGMALDTFGPGPGAAALPPTATARGRLSFQDTVRRLMACFDVLDAARFPVLCAVQGGCIGGALDLATACDLRYCTADAFFCVQEINIGMAADVGSLQRLPKIVAPAVAREMAYTGERLPADRALAVGLVNAVLPDAAALQAHAMAVARTIAAKSPLAIAGSKLALNYARDHGTAAALAHMAVLQRLPKIVAPAVAREMAFTGERMPAERALAVGLVNAVLPDADALHAHVEKIARSIAAKSPLAIAGSKLALNYARDHGTAAALAQMAVLQSAIFDVGDIAEAVSAWKGKRAGSFDPLEAVPRG